MDNIMAYIFYMGTITALMVGFLLFILYYYRAVNNNTDKEKNIEKEKRIDNTNGVYVDTDRYLNAVDDDLPQDHSNESRLIQKCNVCGRKSELSFSYCPYCGSFLRGDIVDDTEK